MDVRDEREAGRNPLPDSLRSQERVVHLPEEQLHAALSQRGGQWPQPLAERGVGAPHRGDILVFLGANQRQVRRCVAHAASLGYLRCAFLDSDLDGFERAVDKLAPVEFIGRDAAAGLLGPGWDLGPFIATSAKSRGRNKLHD